MVRSDSSFRRPTSGSDRGHRQRLSGARLAASFFALLGAAAPLHSLTGGTGPVEPVAGAPSASVGSLAVGAQLFSGVLIDRSHVLTAAHVVAGAEPGQVVFRSSLARGFVTGAASIQVHPDYRGRADANSRADPTAHHDLAIVRLSQPAPTTLPVAVIHAGPLLGQRIHMVSHGGSTTLVTLGENQVDHVFRDAQGRPATYLFDVDGPDLSSNRIGPSVPAFGTLGAGREAGLAAGDSGSAAFVVVDGHWRLAGINTFTLSFGPGPLRPGAQGTGGGGIVLACCEAWIKGVVAADGDDDAHAMQPRPSGRDAVTRASGVTAR